MANAVKLREHEQIKCKIIQIAKKDDRLAITYGALDDNCPFTRTIYSSDKWFALTAQPTIGPPWDHELGINPWYPFKTYKKK